MRHFCCAALFFFHFVCAETVFALSLSLEIPEAIGIVENTPKKVSFSLPTVFSEITQVDLTLLASLLSGEGSLFAYFLHPTDFFGPFVSIDTDELLTPNSEITRSFNPLFQDEAIFDFLLGGEASLELIALP